MMSSAGFRRMFNRMRHHIGQEEKARRVVAALPAGLLVGMLDIFVGISFAVLIFSGHLSDYVARGIGFILFGSMVISAVIALTSSFRGMVAVIQDSPVAILALLAGTVTSEMAASADSEQMFVTVMATIIITSVMTGILFFLLGTFQLGTLIRFIPYPVVGGFLAGTGWLLLQGAIGTMADIPLDLAHYPTLFQAEVFLRWFPGVLFGIVLVITLRRYTQFWVMPVIVMAGVGLFYLVLLLTNTSLSAATEQGWLLGPFPEGGLWQPVSPSSVASIEWSAIFGNIESLGIILVISVISLLLNTTGIELAVQQDIDVNRELRAAGIANILAGSGGAPVGFQTLSLTTLVDKFGIKSRVAGLSVAAMFGVALFVGASVLSFFPKPVVGGLLAFLGLAFLIEWVYDAWFTLPNTEYGLILVILGSIGVFGFLEGVGIGILMAVVLFVIDYSRINVVKHMLSGKHYRSNVDRAVPYQRILDERGDELAIFKLQGVLFFGTADSLLTEIRQRIDEPDLAPLRFVVFDFSLVTGLDSSALNRFIKLKQIAAKQQITLVFTQLSSQIRHQFERGGYLDKTDPTVKIFSDLDHGVEWCEECIFKAEIQENPPGSTLDKQEFLESVFDEIIKSLEHQERFETLVTD
ncbi:STAS domain-containing protein, partial [candidate division KSB3 bacterium]|nr:STAS domain-containing protein [candidate division KSB3 bacterium]MBD3327665.1 STAS domain-containing protein [candidate division KSB3 bacterium]